jgi:hypothetical protein
MSPIILWYGLLRRFSERNDVVHQIDTSHYTNDHLALYRERAAKRRRETEQKRVQHHRECSLRVRVRNVFREREREREVGTSVSRALPNRAPKNATETTDYKPVCELASTKVHCEATTRAK